jgi:CheY-like chemotaxis protein
MSMLKRILLAEDDHRDVELTLMALSDFRVANKVDVVRDGTEVLDYLYRRGGFADRDSEKPVVILLDLKMPKMNGLEVLRQMKTDENLKMIPVVMLTSSREERDIVESYKLGVNAYVVKPVDFGQFVDAIKQIGFFWAVVNQAPPEDMETQSKQTTRAAQ